jgi:Ca2+-binding RTX toxin-like protein
VDGFSAGGTGSPPRSGDFFLPGTDVEGYVIGFNVGSDRTNFVQDELGGNNQIGATTANNSSGSTNSAITSATFSGPGGSVVTFQQVISFDSQDSFFKTEITVTNSGSVTLEDFRYMRTMDPDQDADLSGLFETHNDVVSNPTGTVVTAIAQAKGPNSQIDINLISTDGSARASNFGFQNTNVFASEAFASPVDAGGNDANTAITLTIDFGDIAAGASVTKSFFTAFQGSGFGAANDMLVGTAFGNTIIAGDGNDTIFDLAGADVVRGGAGNDTIIAGTGSDTYDGQTGNDTLDYRDSPTISVNFSAGDIDITGGDNDQFSNIEGIIGSAGADTIVGDSANQTITGSGGKDTLTGGSGADTFGYLLPSDGEVRSANGSVGTNNGDVIVDFVSGTDTISLTKASFGFNSISNGVNFEVIGAGYNGTNSTLGEFASGNPVLIYSQADDALIYDENGASAGYTILLNNSNASTNDIVATDIVLV